MRRETLILLFLLFSFLIFNSVALCSPLVRVAVLDGVSELSLDVDAKFRVNAVKDNALLLKKEKAADILVKISDAGFFIGKEKIDAESFEIKRLDQGFISINGRFFRGSLRFIRQGPSSFLVVNYLGLEDYIRGVLYHEISHLWPRESMKAQAVIVRTFALSRMGENKNKEFDLRDDVYSQMYGGRTSERWRTNKAVQKTRGEILTFEGKIFSTYYHATCGGHTEDAAHLWGEDIAVLKGVVCSFCQDSPHFKWAAYLDTKRLQERLNAAGLKAGVIKKIEIIERSNSNRVLKLRITSSSPDVEIPGKTLRQIIGHNIIRSTNFKIKFEGGLIFFDGFGWGHGVGMCQWGAYFRGKKGYKYREILAHYYPRSKLEKP